MTFVIVADLIGFAIIVVGIVGLLFRRSVMARLAKQLEALERRGQRQSTFTPGLATVIAIALASIVVGIIFILGGLWSQANSGL